MHSVIVQSRFMWRTQPPAVVRSSPDTQGKVMTPTGGNDGHWPPLSESERGYSTHRRRRMTEGEALRRKLGAIEATLHQEMEQLREELLADMLDRDQPTENSDTTR